MENVTEKFNIKFNDHIDSNKFFLNYNQAFNFLWEQVSVQIEDQVSVKIEDQVGGQLFRPIKNKLESSDI